MILNVKHETIKTSKHLEKHKLLSYNMKNMILKWKTDKVDFIKIKNIRSAKNPVKRIKRQAKDWKKIFADHIANEEQEPKIYLKCLKCKKNFFE